MPRIGVGLLAALLLGASAIDLTPTSLSGHWTARLPIGADSEQLIVDLGSLHSRWVGEFDVPDYQVENYPVAVLVADSRVNLHFANAGAEFKGHLSGEGQRLSGRVYLEGDSLAAELVRTGEAEFSPEFWVLEEAAEDSTRVLQLSSNGEQLRARFNADHRKTRLLMLLSPS